jgi:small subunit ribosomal protein S5
MAEEKTQETVDSSKTRKSRSKKSGPIRLSKMKYQEKVLQVKRVTKVVKGGKKQSFRAVVIVGDGREKVGVGIGRDDESNIAIEKAVLNGKRNLLTVPLTRKASIPHVSQAKFGACEVMLRPGAVGTGVIAGGSVRTVLELAGIKNIVGKQYGSNNILNNAKATVLALSQINEKIELGKIRSSRQQHFYQRILKKSKHGRAVF